MSGTGAGKGSRPRPVVKSEYDKNFDKIFKRPMPCPVCARVTVTLDGLVCPLDASNAAHDTTFLKDGPLTEADLIDAQCACRQFSYRKRS